jgi:hypothetical protein
VRSPANSGVPSAPSAATKIGALSGPHSNEPGRGDVSHHGDPRKNTRSRSFRLLAQTKRIATTRGAPCCMPPIAAARRTQTADTRMAALPNKQGGHRVTYRESQVTSGTRHPVWTANPVTGWRVPAAPFLGLPGRQRVPTTPIVDMRCPWHPRPPIVSLRRTRAESESGSAHRSGKCRCPHDLLHIHSWSPYLPVAGPRRAAPRWRAG